MLFSVLTSKGKVPRDNFHPEVQPWLRGSRSQVAAPSGSGPQTLPSCTAVGARCPGPASPQAPQAAQMAGTRSLRPLSHAVGRRHYVAEAGLREKFTTTSRPGPSQWVALARALEQQDTALSLFLLVRGQVSWRGEASYLTLL